MKSSDTGHRPAFWEEISIPIEEIKLKGDLQLPEDSRGLVVFAHGSGSGRKSPRNRYVASVLNNAGLATLLFDLLTEKEESDDMHNGHLRFNIDLLADRLVRVSSWVKVNGRTGGLRTGFFGASTGAAAAIIAAVTLGDRIIEAVVSRGGRPDMAADYLAMIKVPTLLIVGGHDYEVIRLNREALARITATKDMVIVPGATHLFEEPGALETVATVAKDWFSKYLKA